MVITAVIVVTYILYKKQLQKRNQTSTDLEETYDEIDDLEIKQTTFHNRYVSNEYLHADQVRDPKNLVNDYLSSSSTENNLYQSEEFLSEMEKQTKHNDDIAMELTKQKPLEDPLVVFKTIKDDYLTSTSIENQVHQKEKCSLEQVTQTKQTAGVKYPQEKITKEENGRTLEEKHFDSLCDSVPADYIGEKTSDTLDHSSVVTDIDCFTANNIGEYTKVLQQPGADVKPRKSLHVDIEDLAVGLEENISSDVPNQIKTDTCLSEEENPYLIPKEASSIKQKKESLVENKDNQVTESEDIPNMMISDDVNKQATEHMPQSQSPCVEMNDGECMKSGDDPYLTPLDVKPKAYKDTESAEIQNFSTAQKMIS